MSEKEKKALVDAAIKESKERGVPYGRHLQMFQAGWIASNKFHSRKTLPESGEQLELFKKDAE